MIDLSCSLQLAEPRKQFVQVFFGDAFTCVFYLDDELGQVCLVADFDKDVATRGEFKRILDQVDQYLLETPLIADQETWEVILSIWLV